MLRRLIDQFLTWLGADDALDVWPDEGDPE